MSSYVSTVVPTFFFSVLVSIVDQADNNVTSLLQDWLYLLQRINQQKTASHSNQISLSVVSKLLLKHEHNINSCARDIILRPTMNCIDLEYLKSLTEEWSALIMDTYKQLKRDTALTSSYTLYDKSRPSEDETSVTTRGQTEGSR